VWRKVRGFVAIDEAHFVVVKLIERWQPLLTVDNRVLFDAFL
jgi:hypothetical protein